MRGGQKEIDAMPSPMRIYDLHDDQGKIKQFRVLTRAYTTKDTCIYS